MRNEINRLTELLHTIDPLSDDYEKVLSNLGTLYHINSTYKTEVSMPPVGIEIDAPVVAITAPVVEQPAPIQEKKEEEITKEEPKPSDYVYSKAEVRDILAKASERGVKLQPIITKYVPEGKAVKFSEVPADSYTQLVEEILNAN